jgi:hypothetical protein
MHWDRRRARAAFDRLPALTHGYFFAFTISLSKEALCQKSAFPANGSVLVERIEHLDTELRELNDDVENLSQIWAVAPALAKLALRDERLSRSDVRPE